MEINVINLNGSLYCRYFFVLSRLGGAKYAGLFVKMKIRIILY